MKNKIFILSFLTLTILFWSCVDEPIVSPESNPETRSLSKGVAIGNVTAVLSLESGNSCEGITIDWLGRTYISNSRNGRTTNEILKVNKDGSWSVYAALPGSGQARGLESDLLGNVYVAFATSDPSTNGVYKIGRNRIPKRLRGSGKIGSPNALTFDLLGNLYASSSYGEGPNYEGAVWKYDKRKRKFNLFIKSPLLDGGFHVASNSTLPGANGIAFYPPNKLYVANTFQSCISLITIHRNNQEPTIELIKQHPLELMNIDGIAVDVSGNIYGALPVSTLTDLPPGFGPPPVSPLIMLNPHSKEVSSIVALEDASYFSTPTSIAFGRGWKNNRSVFITNAALTYGQNLSLWANPGIVKVTVGKIGL